MSLANRLAPRSSDVPLGIVLGMLVVLLAVFIPLAVHPPALPESLPLPRVSARSVLDRHAAIRPAAMPAFLDESYTRALAAANAHDGEQLRDAQHDFTSFLVDAGANTPERRIALREAHLRSFLTAVDARSASHPLIELASRHELLPAPASDPERRAQLVSWFDVRWELLGAPEVLRHERVVLGTVLSRLPRDEQLTWLRWSLSIDCGPLLGTTNAQVRTALSIARCADARRQFASAVAALDPSYPERDAAAAIDVLQARALLSVAAATTDEGQRGVLTGLAREAFEHANNTYVELLAQEALTRPRPSRMRRRYLAGTVSAMSR